MHILLLTLFPEYFDSVFSSSILSRAIKANKVSIFPMNIRDFATDKHHVTDDRPYGGGPGMVLKIEPIAKAIQYCKTELVPKDISPLVVLTSAKGKAFTQSMAAEWSKQEYLILICGHYEGVDERVAQHLVDLEVRIGDFVLTGGEPAAAVMVDAVCRLLPGVLGNVASTEGESHSTAGQLGYPQYTRPAKYQGWSVPAELLSGNHAQITTWRETQRSTK